MDDNLYISLAKAFVLQTSKSLFITGKAGTGKTTLLRKIIAESEKNTVIVAPTGVAAINAGGATIHSTFNFPLTAFIPNSDYVDLNIANNRNTLSNHLKYRKEKRKVIEQMDLLIIDEISMVRADLLDAIDFALRFVRKTDALFGGVQLVVFGDLYQLPPVIKDEQWNILKNYYDGAYFFDALAWKKLDALTIELQTIYRQNDENFISILNAIRNGRPDDIDFERLYQNYIPNFQPTTEEKFITLTTHNYKANEINETQLNRLPGTFHSFFAEIEGQFSENAFPAEGELRLKEGAQIMFIRNDTDNHRYYNGKIAMISHIEDKKIFVQFPDESESFELKRVEWENNNYTVDNEGKIVQEKLGAFIQFPIRLAWAVTIHKSQGLTFDKVVVDAGSSFAPGQTYVALSRCRSLEGIILKSAINGRNILVDPRIVAFHEQKTSEKELNAILEHEKQLYAQQKLLKLFRFEDVINEAQDWRDEMYLKQIPEKEKAIELAHGMIAELFSLHELSIKFEPVLLQLFQTTNLQDTDSALMKKVESAIGYYTKQLSEKVIQPLFGHIQQLSHKARVKKYLQMSSALYTLLNAKQNALYEAELLGHKIYQKPKTVTVASASEEKVLERSKKEKGSSLNETYELLKEGKSAEEIGDIRGLAQSTIEGHFAQLIEKGKLNLKDVMDEKRILAIAPYVEKGINLTDLKAKIPFETSFGELRMVVASIK